MSIDNMFPPVVVLIHCRDALEEALCEARRTESVSEMRERAFETSHEEARTPQHIGVRSPLHMSLFVMLLILKRCILLHYCVWMLNNHHIYGIEYPSLQVIETCFIHTNVY